MADDIYAPRREGDTLVIPIFDVIGGWWGVDNKTVLTALRRHKAAKKIRLEIDSPGGSVFDGVALYNKLRKDGRPIEAHVFGMAASMASILLLAADTRVMYPGSMVMIHEPWNLAMGGPTEMEKNRDFLQKIADEMIGIYVARTGGDADAIAEMMREETWMTGDDALAHGFVSTVVAPDDDAAERPEPDTADPTALASWNDRRGSVISMFKHPPESVDYGAELGWSGTEPARLVAAMAMGRAHQLGSFSDALASANRPRPAAVASADPLFSIDQSEPSTDEPSQHDEPVATSPAPAPSTGGTKSKSTMSIEQIVSALALPANTSQAGVCIHLGIPEDSEIDAIATAAMTRLAMDRTAAEEAAEAEKLASAKAAAEAEAQRIESERAAEQARAAAQAEIKRQAKITSDKAEATALLNSIASAKLRATYEGMMFVDDPSWAPDPTNPSAVAPKIVDPIQMSACRAALEANPAVLKSSYTSSTAGQAGAATAAAAAAAEAAASGSPTPAAPLAADATVVFESDDNLDIARTFPRLAGKTRAELVSGAQAHNAKLAAERGRGVDRSKYYEK